ncbi:glycosyltransferase [Saccharibacillus brassicae]|uniref:Glycosyltransferase n=1 Tax=Saccharibacillus brassicae TaxID=2583377 RepID=A0A4Y6UW59_SACBS|nr:glycosyltransferase [Saccharibacillus brassicae]QDH20788.1 glycosyltransferase [Saccharibacillus brassicae]
MFFKKKSSIPQADKISVVIPLYNHEQFIEEAINSVLNQTYQNLELIIIDDGSKDRSLNIAQSFNDPRLQVIAQENKGAHNTINRGLELATGEYLTILNSDDVYEKERFAKLIKYFHENREVKLLCSYIKIIDEKGKVLGVKQGWRNMEPWPVADKKKSFAGANDFTKNLIMSNFISTTSNMMFTKELYESIGGMRNLRFAHDWDFALRAADFGECVLIEEALIRYRIHGTNTIHTNRKHMLFEICWIYAAHIHRFEEKKIFAENLITDIEQLIESINLQGNDKLLWVLLMYLEAATRKGEKEPELIFLNDAKLRESLYKYLQE